MKLSPLIFAVAVPLASAQIRGNASPADQQAEYRLDQNNVPMNGLRPSRVLSAHVGDSEDMPAGKGGKGSGKDNGKGSGKGGDEESSADTGKGSGKGSDKEAKADSGKGSGKGSDKEAKADSGKGSGKGSKSEKGSKSTKDKKPKTSDKKDEQKLTKGKSSK
jgi:hypothetical protein